MIVLSILQFFEVSYIIELARIKMDISESDMNENFALCKLIWCYYVKIYQTDTVPPVRV